MKTARFLLEAGRFFALPHLFGGASDRNVCSALSSFLKEKSLKKQGKSDFLVPPSTPLVAHAESPAFILQRHIGCSRLPINRVSR
jgi:hypothetical protein